MSGWASKTSVNCGWLYGGRLRRPVVWCMFSPGLTRGVELRPKGLILLARSTRSYSCNTASGGFYINVPNSAHYFHLMGNSACPIVMVGAPWYGL